MINNITNISNTNSNIHFKAKKFTKNLALGMENIFLIKKPAYLHGHKSPDDDAGTCLKVLYNFRKRHGLESYICIRKNDLPDLYIKKNNYKMAESSNYNVFNILLDCNASDRSAKTLETLPTFIIDHHSTSEKTFNTLSYIDSTAKSCSSILVRFFQRIHEKLPKADLKSLYCGMLSDFEKSEMIAFKDLKLIKLPALKKDKNSKEVLDFLEKKLSKKERLKIYKHLDILSALTEKEKNFRQKIISGIKVTDNGKLAYITIDPNDKQWAELGMDNTRTSCILRDLRLRIINNSNNDNLLSKEQTEQLKNVKGAIIFYRSKDNYQMRVHSKDDYAGELIKYVKDNLNNDIEAGGHPHRAGGRIHTLDKDEISTFINNFLIAAEKIN